LQQVKLLRSATTRGDATRMSRLSARSNANMDCYLRLQEERLRLDLDVKRAAQIARTNKRTIVRWEEKDLTSFSGLSALARYGYDAQYVCTGRRSINNRPPHGKGVAEESSPYVPAFAPDEVEWITRLRKLDPLQRRLLQAVLDAIAPKPRRAKRSGRKPAHDAGLTPEPPLTPPPS
jgi:hypothetical protein